MKRLVFITFLFVCLVAIFSNLIAALYYAPFLTQLFGAFLACIFFANPLITYALRYLIYTSYYSWRNIIFGINTNRILKKHTYEDIVLLSDVDIFLHMNNSRYRRAMDFARLSYFASCGLWELYLNTGEVLLMVAATGRYRQSLLLFERYKIITKLVFWDDEKVYFEQRFIGKFKDDDEFVYSVNFVAMKPTKPNPKKIFEDVLGTVPEVPEPTEELHHFLQYLKESSASLKKEKVD